ncbi:MAG: HepT-like ribonuclease domain-containing protein [Candidatus Bathyarchaeia archaeon]
MRDILIHGYFGVDLELTWKVATQEIANLKKEILEIKKELEVFGIDKNKIKPFTEKDRGENHN